MVVGFEQSWPLPTVRQTLRQRSKMDLPKLISNHLRKVDIRHDEVHS